MRAPQLVHLIAATCDVENPPSDGALVQALMETVHVPELEADLAVKLVQIACGRLFLHGLGITFSDEYLCFDGDGEVVERGRLSEHAVFTCALATMAPFRLATKYFALTSAEVSSVNQALHGGSDPSDLVCGPSALFMEQPTEAGLAAARRAITESLRRNS